MSSLEVVLLTHVPHLGRVGDTKRVAAGYARNFLFPRQWAAPATPGAHRTVQRQLEKKKALLEGERREAAGLAERLAAVRLEIPCAAGEGGRLFGSVTSRQIAEGLKARGFSVDRKALTLSEPIRALGDYKVSARLHADVQVQVSVTVVPLSR